MWKAILPGEKIVIGDTVRYEPSPSNLSYKLKIYEVVKTDQHYFEMVAKVDDQEDNAESSERRVIKYMDIGYHLGLEVWQKSAQTVNINAKEKSKQK